MRGAIPPRGNSLRRGILLVNLGSPDAPETGAVRRYLREFLSDPRVVDLPAWGRALLLHGVILPFRAPRSAEAYRKIWTARGAPLVVHGLDLAEKLRALAGPDACVELGMRYGRPSIQDGIARLRAAGCGSITAIPLFPQHAEATSGSVAAALAGEPDVRILPAFYDHPAFLDACARRARPFLGSFRPDHLLLSFHGLPERQVTRADSTGAHCLKRGDCCSAPSPANRLCYRFHCFETARGIVERLDLAEGSWEVSFQSRLGRVPWLRPYTDLRVAELARSGVRRLLVLCPAFVADCLETLEEVGLRARESFLRHGGEALELVPSLNASDDWAEALLQILGERAASGDRRNRS